MIVTPPSGVLDTSWIMFNSISRTVSYVQNNPGFHGDYTIVVYGNLINNQGVFFVST